MELSTNLFLIFFVSFLFLTKPVSSQFHFASEFCSDDVGNYTTNSIYHKNLKFMLSSLTTKASRSIFSNDTVGQGIDQAYGLFMCRGDLNHKQCHDCVNDASATILEKCSVQKQAIVWYDECMVRYANHSIFSRMEEAPVFYAWSTLNVSDPETFGKVLSETVNGLIMEAAYNESSNGYAVGEGNVTLFQAVHVMAQCTPDIVGTRCERCLKVAFRDMGGCCGTARITMKMYLPSCWLRYDEAPIVGEFDNRPSPSLESNRHPESPSSIFPPSSPGRSNATTITSIGISFMLRVLMAVMSISFISSF